MTPQRFLLTGSLLFLMAAMTIGCTTGPSEGTGRTDGGGTAFSQQESAALAFQYRQQATEMRHMANRLEMEAQWYAQQLGPDHEQVTRNRHIAKDFWTAADEAEQRARDYQRQVPHNQVY